MRKSNIRYECKLLDLIDTTTTLELLLVNYRKQLIGSRKQTQF